MNANGARIADHARGGDPCRSGQRIVTCNVINIDLASDFICSASRVCNLIAIGPGISAT